MHCGRAVQSRTAGADGGVGGSGGGLGCGGLGGGEDGGRAGGLSGQKWQQLSPARLPAASR